MTQGGCLLSSRIEGEPDAQDELCWMAYFQLSALQQSLGSLPEQGGSSRAARVVMHMQ
jgi:hypothetical protein